MYLSRTDGSEHINITKTPDKDERIPRACNKLKRIAFVTDICQSGRLKSAREGFLAFIDFDGKNREETQVNRMADKDWSPDCTKIAMSWPDRQTHGFRIYDVKTKKVETFATDRKGILDIDWSPDGKLLALGARKEMGYRYTILTMYENGSRMRPFHVGTDDKPYYHPCWRPSAMRIAWNSREGLLVGDYDTETGKSKNVRAVVSFKDVGWEDPCPRWSPDGAYIAYINSGKHLHVVRIPDGVWVELHIPQGWVVAEWNYDWIAEKK